MYIYIYNEKAESFCWTNKIYCSFVSYAFSYIVRDRNSIKYSCNKQGKRKFIHGTVYQPATELILSTLPLYSNSFSFLYHLKIIIIKFRVCIYMYFSSSAVFLYIESGDEKLQQWKRKGCCQYRKRISLIFAVIFYFLILYFLLYLFIGCNFKLNFSIYDFNEFSNFFFFFIIF